MYVRKLDYTKKQGCQWIFVCVISLGFHRDMMWHENGPGFAWMISVHARQALITARQMGRMMISHGKAYCGWLRNPEKKTAKGWLFNPRNHGMFTILVLVDKPIYGLSISYLQLDDNPWTGYKLQISYEFHLGLQIIC